MQGRPEYCPACGKPIQNEGRLCAHCGEPLPAPPTVLGHVAPEPLGPPPAPSPHAGAGTAEQQPLPQAMAIAPAPPPGYQSPPPFVPQPFVAQPLAPQPIAPDPAIPPIVPQDQPTPQVRQPNPIELAATLPINAEVAQIGLADTRKGRVWRSVVGGGALTWGVLMMAMATSLLVAHVTMVIRFGWAHLNDATQATFWVSLTMLVPASVQIAAAAAILRGSLRPRMMALVAALCQVLWAIGAIAAMAATLSSKQGPALVFEVVAGLMVLPSLLFGILALGAGKWLAEGAPGRKPLPVPFRMWGGPLIIVLSVLTFLRLFFPVASVTVQALGRSTVRSASHESFYSQQAFWGAVAACVMCTALVVIGILVSRSRQWALIAGAAVAVLGLIVVVAVPLSVWLQDATYYIGGPAHLPMLGWLCFVHGMAAWVALAGAVGTRFRLAESAPSS